MNTLNNKKTSIVILGSSYKKIEEIQEYINNKHDPPFTKTAIINVLLCAILNQIEPDDIEHYLIEYNRL